MPGFSEKRNSAAKTTPVRYCKIPFSVSGIYTKKNHNKRGKKNSNLGVFLVRLVPFVLTFSRTLQTYWHQRMRKMMMTRSRMMVTRQPIRMGVLLSSCGYVADGLAAAGEISDVREAEFKDGCEAAAKKFALKRCTLLFLTHTH